MVGFASLLPQERAWLRRHSASWMVMMVVKLLGCGGPRGDSLRMDWIWRDLKSYRGMGSILCMNRKLGFNSTRTFFLCICKPHSLRCTRSWYYSPRQISSGRQRCISLGISWWKFNCDGLTSLPAWSIIDCLRGYGGTVDYLFHE